MVIITAGFYMFGLLGLCTAFPISVQIGDRNAFLLGALALVSLGTIIAGCLCCGRRKKGFKEFKDESGTTESNKTEYPIFSTLSTVGHCQLTENNTGHAGTSRSNEHLINDDEDNNNGPISPDDLQNIENNNAVDYIRNQNEINVIVEPSLYTINRNLQNNENRESQNVQMLQDIAVSSTNESEKALISLQSSISCSSDNLSANINLDNLKDTEIINNQKVVEENFLINKKNEFTTSHTKSFVVQIENAPEYEVYEHNLEAGVFDESSSIQSASSGKSNEFNSVEEALRVLDNVIADEDSISLRNLENINGENCLVSKVNHLHTFNICENENSKNINYELIQKEAINFINEIIFESEQIVNEKMSKDKINIINIINTSNKSITSLDDFEKNYETTNLDSSSLRSIESMENLFENEFLTKTSTPFIQNKIMPKIVIENGDKPKMKFNQILFDDFHEIENPPQNILLDNDTFNLTKTIEQADIKIEDKTFEIDKISTNNNITIYSGDPCTSKQALERDICGITLKCEKDEINSEDLSTVTPVNTPIELNYANDTWNKITENLINTKNDDYGWHLHPENVQIDNNDTYDIEDDPNSEITLEALRKQLAEVLPKHQNISGPLDHHEDHQENDRSFDEYRSPFDDPLGLFDDKSSSSIVQNEIIINYKRSLSPIMEESEDETLKTFVMNETKCLDSTSTGFVDTGEAIMGVSKALMASNDTLFNFEDTLGEKEDIFSPRTPSRNDNQVTNSIKSSKSTEENSFTINDNELEKSENDITYSHSKEFNSKEKQIPPKTIILDELLTYFNVNELCSPDQQKTFSEGTSSNTDHISSDISPTIDHDTTFTTNTIDDKTCLTVMIKDDDRISEVSEPEWISSVSNSLTNIPNLEYNINNLADNKQDFDFANDKNIINTSFDLESYNNSTRNDITKEINEEKNLIDDCNLLNGLECISSQNNIIEKSSNNIIGSLKENENPNKGSNVIENIQNGKELNIKVQNDANDTVIKDELMHFQEGDSIIKDIGTEMQENNLSNNRQQDLFNDSLNVVDNTKTQLNLVTLTNQNISQLSGEEDPWADIVNEINSDQKNNTHMISTSFSANDWDSDVDDSHSSEEFMYIRGIPNDINPELIEDNNIYEITVNNCEFENQKNNTWSTHKDKIPIGNSVDEEISDESSTDCEGEFVPSCWDSMAIPSRSALKSPDKSSSEEDDKSGKKKRRSVVFKNQKYHSVYEYPKENAPISPAYSAPCIWNKSSFEATLLPSNSSEEFNDGFMVSSSMRPFYRGGSQHNTFCHTWPTDSDFSWSQIESIGSIFNAENETSRKNDISSPKQETHTSNKLKHISNYDNSSRPDSGVGESAEMLSDRFPLGELCHAKPLLRLPLENIQSTAQDRSKGETTLIEPEIILPTPSCSGSMDSLSSNNSDIDHQIGLINFNKKISENEKIENILSKNDKIINLKVNFLQNEENDLISNVRKIRQNDSTDEDSGIESIMKINKV